MINRFNTDEIDRVVSSASSESISPDLPGIIYSLGRDAENEEEFEYAFQLLASLSSHQSIHIVSMVILAFSLLAVYHKRLERGIAEPVIRKAWAAAEGLDKARIEDAVDDINDILKWNLKLEHLKSF